jgi:hypothetical protein
LKARTNCVEVLGHSVTVFLLYFIAEDLCTADEAGAPACDPQFLGVKCEESEAKADTRASPKLRLSKG